jgi:ankyrin repeat protein
MAMVGKSFTKKIKSFFYKIKNRFDGRTELIDAILRNDQKEIKKLLEEGIDPNQKGLKTETPLIVAIENNNPIACQLLIDYGVNVNNTKYNTKYSPLLLAVEKNNNDIVNILIKGKSLARPNDSELGNKQNNIILFDVEDRLILETAYQNNNKEIISRLRELGIKDNLIPKKLIHIFDGAIPKENQIREHTSSRLEATSLNWLKENANELDPIKHPYLEDINKHLQTMGNLYDNKIFENKSNLQMLKKQLKKLKANEQFLLPCPIPGHLFYFNIKKLPNNKYEIIMSERGLLAATEDNSVKLRSITVNANKIDKVIDDIYSLKDLSLDQVISNFSRNKDTMFGEKFTLKEGYNLKPFKNGICGYANLKTAIRVMLTEKYGLEKGEKYYKDFALSLREIELKNIKNYDYEYLKKIGINLDAYSLTDMLEAPMLAKRQKLNVKHAEDDLSKSTIIKAGILTEDQAKLFTTEVLNRFGSDLGSKDKFKISLIKEILKQAKEYYADDEKKGLQELATSLNSNNGYKILDNDKVISLIKEKKITFKDMANIDDKAIKLIEKIGEKYKLIYPCEAGTLDIINHHLNYTFKSSKEKEFIFNSIIAATSSEGAAQFINSVKIIERSNNGSLEEKDLYAEISPSILGYALSSAINKNENYNLIQTLIEKGADPNIRDNGGDTALIYAVKQGNNELVQKLLEKGANPNLLDSNETPPIIFAVIGQNIELTNLLLENGADPNAKDLLGNNALKYAHSQEISNLLTANIKTENSIKQSDEHKTNTLKLPEKEHGILDDIKTSMKKLFHIGDEEASKSSDVSNVKKQSKIRKY